MEDYSGHYSEESLKEKLSSYAIAAGRKVVYQVLLLYNVLTDKNTPLQSRLVIIAALGYFIFPLDGIPDLTPLIGYSDDLGVLLFTISQVTGSITPSIRKKTEELIRKWFPEPPTDENADIPEA